MTEKVKAIVDKYAALRNAEGVTVDQLVHLNAEEVHELHTLAKGDKVDPPKGLRTADDYPQDGMHATTPPADTTTTPPAITDPTPETKAPAVGDSVRYVPLPSERENFGLPERDQDGNLVTMHCTVTESKGDIASPVTLQAEPRPGMKWHTGAFYSAEKIPGTWHRA